MKKADKSLQTYRLEKWHLPLFYLYLILMLKISEVICVVFE